jgi:prepilin-type N-terminal cleavage/methylation domain-containing protein
MMRRVNDRRGLDAPQSGKRAAYTLVEMLLVIAVIGTLAAMTWPSVLRMQADHNLSSAAEQVRLQLAAARTKAIKSGEKYQFLYEPKGRHFAVVPQDPEPENPQAVSNANPAAASPAPTPNKSQKNTSGELPAKLTFVSTDMTSTVSLSSQKISATAFQGLNDAGTLASVGWSEPLVFAPDGSAMDAVVTISDHRGQQIDLNVRGLTGATAVSSMRQEAAR